MDVGETDRQFVRWAGRVQQTLSRVGGHPQKRAYKCWQQFPAELLEKRSSVCDAHTEGGGGRGGAQQGHTRLQDGGRSRALFRLRRKSGQKTEDADAEKDKTTQNRING